MKTTLVLLLLVGFVFSAAAQVDTNKSAQFKIKIVSHGPGGDGTSINPTPEAISPGSEGADTVTNPGKESELKWKFIGRRGGKDVYQFTFARTMKEGGASLKTTSSKEVLFDGKRAVIFEDELHTVIIESPSEQDLKDAAPRKQV